MTMENSYMNRQIGNYRVISELANGAYGRVYLAQHTVLMKRTVAIKLLHITHLGSVEEREDFLREAQFLEELKHPYILPILDVGIEDGSPYIVAEYAPNGSLRDRIKSHASHPLPFQEVLTILSQIGQALHYAHQRQVIHRDLKPENILFNVRNEALLADFGLATSLSTTSIKHIDSAGTPRYMAPEQFQGNVSKESDQYCLACIAYELVTGRPPFLDKDFFAIGFKHLTGNPTPPTQLNPYLPVTVEQVILKAMAKQRTDRYPDISSFVSALLQATDSQLHVLASSEIEMPTLFTSSTNSTSASELNPKTPTFSNRGSLNITEPGITEIDRNQTILDAPLYNERPEYRSQNPLTPLPPVQESKPLIPFPAAPFQDISTAHTVESSQPSTRSNMPNRTKAHYIEDNPALLPVTTWETRHRRPTRAGSGYRWAFLTILCLALGAGIMAILLLGIFPMFSSHDGSNPSGSPQQARGTGSSSTPTPGRPSQHSTPPGKPNSRPTANSTGQRTPNSTPQVKSSPTGQPTAHTTPNVTPPPTTQPTPTPTSPPTSETLIVDFTNPNSVQTAYSYSGYVTVTVSGEGGVAPSGWSDAFYEYTDFSGNSINPPQHTRCWVMYIYGQQSDGFVPTPAFNPGHSYQFTMTASGGPINFSICDNTRSDNHGSLIVTVTGNGSRSSATKTSTTSNTHVQAISINMLAEESKKN